MAQTVDGPTPAGEQAASATPAARRAPAASVKAPPVPPAPPVTAREPAAAAPATRALPRLSRPKPAQRRTRVMVRSVGPLSVLKFSLIFTFCVMLSILLGLVFLFMILQAIGVIDSIEEWVTKIFPAQDSEATFQIQPGYLFPRAFLIGCGMVVIWSLINVMVVFLYNLISDVVGGVEITLAEKK